jgi:hypothetical protein
VRQNLSEQSNKPIDRKVAVQTLIAGVVAAVLCVFTSQFGFVSRLALVLAPSLLLLGLAGLADVRILRAALKKPGESVAHLPLWVRLVGYVCWCPTLAILGYLIIQNLISR